MKKLRQIFISTVLLFGLIFAPQMSVLAEEKAQAGEPVTQASPENPDTGIVETVGTGAVLALAGSGSLAGTILLKKLHKDPRKNDGRHR